MSILRTNAVGMSLCFFITLMMPATASPQGCICANASLVGDNVATKFSGGPVVNRTAVDPGIELPNAGPTLGAAGPAPRWNIDFGINTIRIDFLQQIATYGAGAAFTFSNLNPQLSGCPPVSITGVQITTNKPTVPFNVAAAVTFTADTVTVPIAGLTNLDWQPGEFILVKLEFCALCDPCEDEILMELAAIEAKLDKLLDEFLPTEEPCCGKPPSAFDSVDDRSSATTPQTISGTSRKDCLIGGSAGDVIAGRGDDDCIIGNGGNDELHGDQGITVLNSGKDTVFGGPGHDTIHGDANDDEIHGGEDGDDIFGDAGADRIFGDGGDDTINGDAGQDFIDGGEGDDIIVGDAGSDTLCGGPGGDRINGRAQGDEIDGGADTDNCDGDSGADDCWRCEARNSCSSQNGSLAACPP